jgi:hypothetical protein
LTRWRTPASTRRFHPCVRCSGSDEARLTGLLSITEVSRLFELRRLTPAPARDADALDLEAVSFHR